MKFGEKKPTMKKSKEFMSGMHKIADDVTFTKITANTWIKRHGE